MSIENRNGWQHVVIPMIAEETEKWEFEKVGKKTSYTRYEGEVLHPEHESIDSVMQRKHRVGTYIFESQYQQNPCPDEGQVIKKEWIRRYDPDDFSEIPFDAALISCDPAAKDGPKNDYTAICVYFIIESEKGRQMFLRKVLKNKLTYKEIKDTLIRFRQKLSRKYKIPVYTIIEDTMSGTPLIQELREEEQKIYPFRYGNKDKYERLMDASIAFEHGNIYHPTHADWLKDYEKELFSFPNTRHDDQVDATSQAILFRYGNKNYYQRANIKYDYVGRQRVALAGTP